ncbi:ACT domain-containing protein [Paenibacillus campi]|uniref:ACT domain-containing protein n=1 Tax=Paenibacillus campi TaxID=3106031 RepID=UPI002AFE93C5|nr:ACT domain-containing protein [Paenibacillus sp. SGZ-1009]
MKGIITMLGKDKVGIVAGVRTYVAGQNVNILDISQTIVQDYFNMMMIVDASNAVKAFEGLVEDLQQLGIEIGVEIKLQHEDIFNTMHRIY